MLWQSSSVISPGKHSQPIPHRHADARSWALRPSLWLPRHVLMDCGTSAHRCWTRAASAGHSPWHGRLPCPQAHPECDTSASSCRRLSRPSLRAFPLGSTSRPGCGKTGTILHPVLSIARFKHCSLPCISPRYETSGTLGNGKSLMAIYQLHRKHHTHLETTGPTMCGQPRGELQPAGAVISRLMPLCIPADEMGITT
jgi:hypothetical protein